MNLPNQLTVSRFCLTVAFLLAIFLEFPFSRTAALILFVAASLTDYFDGKIARQNKLVTNFGILMDPLVDKILTCSAFIAFVDGGWLAGWMAVIIVARELAITGLRLLAAAHNVVLPAERLGKHKTTAQLVAIIAILVMISYSEWGKFGETLFASWIGWFVEISTWIAVILTLVSGAIYLWRNRQLYATDV